MNRHSTTNSDIERYRSHHPAHSDPLYLPIQFSKAATSFLLPSLPPYQKYLNDICQTAAAALPSKEMIPSQFYSPVVLIHRPDAPPHIDVDSILYKSSVVVKQCPYLSSPKGDVATLPVGWKGPDASKAMCADISSPTSIAICPVDILKRGHTTMETNIGETSKVSVVKKSVEKPFTLTHEE